VRDLENPSLHAQRARYVFSASNTLFYNGFSAISGRTLTDIAQATHIH